MKSLKKLALIVLLAGSTGAYSQLYPEGTTLGEATVTDDTYCVSLNADQPVQEYYELNIASQGFTTFEDAHRIYGAISNNLLTYKVDIDNQRVILQVHIDRTEEPQDIVWWNAYLESLCGL